MSLDHAELFVNCNVFVSELANTSWVGSSHSRCKRSLAKAVVVPAGLSKYLGRFHLVEKSICAIIVLQSDKVLLNTSELQLP